MTESEWGRDRRRLLPEWAERWPDIFPIPLGLSAEIAAELMTGSCRELVGLDPGLNAVPHVVVAGLSHTTGVPWRIQAVGLESLGKMLLEAIPMTGPKPCE